MIAKKIKIFRLLLLLIFIPTVIFVCALALLSLDAMKKMYLQQTKQHLEEYAVQIAHDISAIQTTDVFSNRIYAYQNFPTRITIINKTGNVLFDSNEDPDKMDNHATRPEILQALNGKTGVAVRYSHTLTMNMMYTAVPCYINGMIYCIVRTALPVSVIRDVVRAMYRKIGIAVIVIVLLAFVISYRSARYISRSLEEIKKGADRFALGEFSPKLPHNRIYEIDGLAAAMNDMSKQLQHRINTILRERNESDVIVTSMHDGLIAVDVQGNIIKINTAAAQLFDIDEINTLHKPIVEVIRYPKIHSFLEKTLHSSSPVESEITLYLKTVKHIHISGSVIRNSVAETIGALLVFNDITRLKKLTELRKEFVANVSHELKTPITSIRGYTELLLNGVIDDKQEAQSFLHIIEKHSKRLCSIIDDLLTLSQLEQSNTARTENNFKSVFLPHVISNALQVCANAITDKNIVVAVDCDDITLSVIPSLFDHALINLIDNAVKYSEKNGIINISAVRSAQHCIFRISDNGCGIEKKYHDKIFERFYRIDTARSRALGGTGLGLAIVKHIVHKHHGSISVESTINVGTTFTLCLPMDLRDPLQGPVLPL